MMSTITEQVEIAIAKPYAPTLAKLIEICDKLHKGIEVDGYTADDIPTDSLYEQLKQKYEQLEVAVTAKIASGRKAKGKALSDMHMAKDAIIKNNAALVNNETVICMPKYDGVSCAVRFVWKDDSFVVDDAETRGTDVGFKHKNTNMKDRINQLFESDTCPWVKRLNKMHEKYSSVTVRGEIVLVDKTIKPAAPYVAGKINKKSEVFDEDGVIGFKMFEITRLINLEEEVIVPSQQLACKIISKIDKTVPYLVVELGDHATDQLMEIYTKWNEELDSPIDGVVYCDPKWKYPQTEAESSGVNYGKYAMKPTQYVPTTFDHIEYKVGKDGKLTPKIIYKKVSIDGKNYEKAKSSITEIVKFIDEKHVGPGSTIDIKLNGSIPKVIDVIADTSDDPIDLITECPECGGELTLKKGKVCTLACTNIECPGMMIKQLVTLFKTLSITGYAEKTIGKLLKENDNNYFKLFPAVDKKKGPDFVKNQIYNCEIGNLIYGTNIATRVTLKKIEYMWDIRDSLVSEEIDTVRDFIGGVHTIIARMVATYL